MAKMSVVAKNDVSIKKIDRGLKNKWSWTWLDRKLVVKDEAGLDHNIHFEKCIRKLDLPGKFDKILHNMFRQVGVNLNSFSHSRLVYGTSQ